MAISSEDLDNGDAGEKQGHAGETRGGDLPLREAEPALAVDEERGDLLAPVSDPAVATARM
jgi:hypothetical protein